MLQRADDGGDEALRIAELIRKDEDQLGGCKEDLDGVLHELTHVGRAGEHTQCGPGVVTLRSVLAFILSNGQKQDASQSLTFLSELGALLKQSHEQMTAVHHSRVERKWRRLYTDVALIKGLLVASEDRHDDKFVRKAIGDLDKAIIIAAAPGLGRLELVHRAISILQQRLPAVGEGSSEKSATKSSQEPKHFQPDFIAAQHAIKELSDLPELEDYLAHYHKEPFLVRGGALDWPVFDGGDDQMQSRWADAAYLLLVAGPARSVPVEIGRMYTATDWRQEIMPWEDFLVRSRWGSRHLTGDQQDGLEVRYLAQHNLFDQFPALRRDVLIPDLVYAGPPAPQYMPAYSPPVDAEDGLETVLLNAWMGPKDTVSPAHRDPYYNFYGTLN